VEELSAAEVAARFGYTPAVVHQMASELRAGKAQFFAASKPGPKGPRKTERIRDRVLLLRAQERSCVGTAEAVAVGRLRLGQLVRRPLEPPARCWLAWCRLVLG
jgi:hypothetical protein